MLEGMPRSRRIPHVLLLIETSRAYGRGLVEGIARYAETHGPWSIQFDERGLADPLPRWLRNWQGDGIIARSTSKRDTARLRATRLPVIELYSYHDSDFPCVRPDEADVARLAIEHFLDHGLRTFAFYCTGRAHWSNRRYRAFAEALRQRGHTCHRFLSPLRPLAADNAYRRNNNQSLIRWLQRLPKPCGMFCASDFFAAHLLQTCRLCGVAVPDEIAVLGVDNDPVFCGVCLPRLSSIDLGSARIGYEAAATLHRLIRRRTVLQTRTEIPPQGVVARGSTDILAIDDADVAQAVRLIRAQACRPLQVAEVAAAVGLSRRSLEQRFQRALSHTPKHEILKTRMESAKTLLAAGEAVASAARKCGFASPKYFARAFRLWTGLAPQNYRAQQKSLVACRH
jgi:LacI family transcriptional regulator